MHPQASRRPRNPISSVSASTLDSQALLHRSYSHAMSDQQQVQQVSVGYDPFAAPMGGYHPVAASQSQGYDPFSTDQCSPHATHSSDASQPPPQESETQQPPQPQQPQEQGHTQSHRLVDRDATKADGTSYVGGGSKVRYNKQQRLPAQKPVQSRGRGVTRAIPYSAPMNSRQGGGQMYAPPGDSVKCDEKPHMQGMRRTQAQQAQHVQRALHAEQARHMYDAQQAQHEQHSELPPGFGPPPQQMPSMLGFGQPGFKSA